MHITLDAVATTALALLLLATGAGLKRRLNWLEHFCVPTPVIGGFGFALLAWLLRDMGIVTFELDTAMQSPLMIAFFTTVGLGGSLALLKKGGKALGVYLVACWATGADAKWGGYWHGQPARPGPSDRAYGRRHFA